MKPRQPAGSALGRDAAPSGVTIDDTGELADGVTTEPVPPTPGTPAPDGTLEASRASDRHAPAAPHAAPAILDLPVIARERYESLGEHARGGLGRVMRAQDRHLGRSVAIKEMLAPADDPGATARFVREALVTSRLQHPGIVPVYDAGYWPGGEPFYAMKLVSGRSLREAISAARGLDERLALLPHVLATAQAIAYAHSEGVIHRDLKPSNVMLGPFGETVVVDWGLAKDLHAAEAAAEAERPADVYALSHFDMTRVGAVVGTPGFMPPEQAAGESVDERADVYALGAILYALLAGEAPSPSAPAPIATVAPGAPRDLVAIVAKAMAPAAEARYADAGAFAADLSRFQAGQLVGAREYGVLTRVARFFSRRRLPLAVSAVLVALLVVVTVEAFRRVLAARGRAEARSNELVLSQARAYLETDPTASLAWLEQYPADGADVASAADIAAEAVSRGVARHVLYGAGGAHLQDARLSPDGTCIATTDGKSVAFVDAASGAFVRHVALPDVMRVGFAPDGRHLVALGQHGDVWWIEVAGGAPERLGGHRGWVQIYAFDAAGARLATAGPGGDVLVFSLATRAAPLALQAHEGTITSIAFTRSGDLVTSGVDGSVRAWPGAAGPANELRAADGKPVFSLTADHQDNGVVWAEGGAIVRHDGHERHELGHHAAAVTVLALTDGDLVVSGSTDGQVIGWDGSQGTPVVRLGAAASALALGPDDAIAAGDQQGLVVLWRGAETTTLRGHTGVVRRLAFRPDGDLLSMAEDGVARSWHPPAARRRLFAGGRDVYRLVWSPRSDALAAGSRDGSVTWFAGLENAEPLGRHVQTAYGIALTPDGRTVISGGWDGVIGVWPIDRSAPRRLVHGSQVWNVAVDPAGRRLASVADDGSVKLWDLASGEGHEIYRHRGDATDVAFSPDGRIVASLATNGQLHLHDLGGGEARDLDAGAAGANSLVFGRDGRHVYVACLDGAVRDFDLAATRPQGRVLTRHALLSRAVALSPDGRRLASGGGDGEVHIVELPSGRVRVLRGHAAESRHVAFSPDGRLVASAGWDGVVRVWDLASGAAAVLRVTQQKAHRVAFSPDGRWLASTGSDGVVGLWAVAKLVEDAAPPEGLAAWLEKRTTATMGTNAPLATR